MLQRLSRRQLISAAAAGMVTAACGAPSKTGANTPMDIASFHAARRFANTASGQIAYIEQGSGPVALFIHGVPLNGFHWRHVIAAMQATRRCIALDLMGLGYSKISPTQDVSFTAQAHMVREFMDALGLTKVDLISNDSGGAVAQIFAAHNPERLRSTNWPPEAVLPSLQAARDGVLLDRYVSLIDNAEERYVRWARAYADPRVLTDEVYRLYIDPLRATPDTRNNFHRYWIAFDHAQTVAVESKLRQLQVPTLVVWALEDIYFDVKWAYWLKATIPGVVRVVEVPGAKLFFPEDRPHTLIAPLQAFLKELERA
jgi:pimeloyl-ACP methyl ester carboxylesterase